MGIQQLLLAGSGIAGPTPSNYFIGPMDRAGVSGYLLPSSPTSISGTYITSPHGATPASDAVSEANGVLFWRHNVVGYPVMVSFNGGASWTAGNDELYESATVEANPVVWTGTKYWWRNKTSVDGLTWITHPTLPTPVGGGTAIVFWYASPTMPGYVWLSYNAYNDCFRSADNGATWTQVPGIYLLNSYHMDNGSRLWGVDAANGPFYTDDLMTTPVVAPSIPPENYHMKRVGTTWVGINAARIVRATGSGTTWSNRKTLSPAPDYNGKQFAHNGTDWIFLHRVSTASMKLCISTDDGLTWPDGAGGTITGWVLATSIFYIP